MFSCTASHSGGNLTRDIVRDTNLVMDAGFCSVSWAHQLYIHLPFISFIKQLSLVLLYMGIPVLYRHFSFSGDWKLGRDLLLDIYISTHLRCHSRLTYQFCCENLYKNRLKTLKPLLHSC